MRCAQYSTSVPMNKAAKNAISQWGITNQSGMEVSPPGCWRNYGPGARLSRGTMLHDARNRDARNRDARNRDARNRDARNRDARNRDARNRDARNRDARNRDARNRDARNRDARNRSTRTLGPASPKAP